MYEVIVFVVFFGLVGFGLYWIRRGAEPAERALKKLHAEVNAMSIEDAEVQAERMLQKSRNWEITLSQKEQTAFDPTTNSFFSKYEALYEKDGLGSVDRNYVKPSRHKGYVQLNSGEVHDVTLLELTSGEIVDLDASEKPSEGLCHKSIYHWLLYQLKLEETDKGAEAE